MTVRKSVPSEPPVQPKAPDPLLPAYLGLTAGVVDVTGWLTLGGLFTAHITGNLVVMAAGALDGRDVHLMQVVSVPAFVVIAAAMGAVAPSSRWIRARLEGTLLALQFTLLLGAAVVAAVTRPSHDPHGPAGIVVGLLAIAAMASQNALLRLSRDHAPATAVMTGNLVECTLSLVACFTTRGGDRDKALAQCRSTWPTLAGFLFGCALGALAVRLCNDAAWFVAALATAAIGLARWWPGPRLAPRIGSRN